MKGEEIAQLRQTFSIPEEWTDEDMRWASDLLRGRYNLLPPEGELIKYLLELKGLRKTNYSSKPQVFSELIGLEVFWIFKTETLFLHGDFGPCCAWARAAVEFYLRAQCLGDQTTKKAYQKLKDDSKHGENPSIRACLKILGESPGNPKYDLCVAIGDSAGTVLHHRMEKLISKERLEDKFGSLGHRAIDILTDNRDILRPSFERDEAARCLTILYELCQIGAIP